MNLRNRAGSPPQGAATTGSPPRQHGRFKSRRRGTGGRLCPVTEVGTAVAGGVLPDTLFVRAVLVPARLPAFGQRVWWRAGRRRDR
jgi:hypothetical protein